jgi:hypothetical protein
MFGAEHLRRWGTRAERIALLVLLAVVAANAGSGFRDATVEELKGKLSSAGMGERPKLCLEIAQKELAETDKLYAASEMEKAQATLTDAVAYSELARDYSLQTHKHEKETEIAVRGMTRRLNDILHTLGHEDQEAVHDALKRLQHVRDDLLKAMFPKGEK